VHQMCPDSAPLLAIANWYSFLTGQKTEEDASAPAGILCDVRDVARCHTKALLLPEAAGQRFGIATRE
jgi:nucleoside-diphosphate-sugar epimerase